MVLLLNTNFLYYDMFLSIQLGFGNYKMPHCILNYYILSGWKSNPMSLISAKILPLKILLSLQCIYFEINFSALSLSSNTQFPIKYRMAL